MIWKLVLACLMMAAITGCRTGCPTCRYTPPIPPIVPVNLRRPPVMAYNEPVVINFCDEIDRDKPDEDHEGDVDFDEIGTRDPYKPMIEEYYLGIGDVLDIYISGDPHAHQNPVVVAPDGKIYFYLLDGIYVEGLRIDQAKKLLEDKLTDIYLAPDVTIIPRTLSNLNYVILGRVNLPNLYPLVKSTTIRQALGIAGGLLSDDLYFGAGGSYGGGGVLTSGVGYTGLSGGQYRNLKNSFIMRNGKRLPIDFEKLVLKGDSTQDIFLKPGDYIYISAKQDQDIYVLGNVFYPQAIKYRNNITFIAALATATGWQFGGPYGADLHRGIVIRGDLKAPQVIEVDVKLIITGKASDFYLQPGDIVYLSNKRFRFGRELVYLALTTFIESFGNAAGSYYGDRMFGIEGEVPVVTP